MGIPPHRLSRQAVNSLPQHFPPPRSAPSAAADFVAWLADLPHQIGVRLFLTADEEAYWRGWRITQRWGGLARAYRDTRFELGWSAARSAPTTVSSTTVRQTTVRPTRHRRRN